MSKSLLRSSIVITLVLVGGYFLSFGREAVMASLFGICKEIDAFTMAIQIPVMLFAIFAVSVRSTILPLYSKKLYSESPEEANLFAVNFFNILFVFSFIFVLIGELLSGVFVHILAPGFDEYTHDLATQLLRISLPSVILTMAIDILTAVLHVHKKFIYTAFATYAINITFILVLILFYKEWGIFAAIIGQVLGIAIQALLIFILVRKHFKYSFILNLKDKTIRKGLKMSVPVMWSIAVAQVNSSFSKIVASFMDVGSISALNYATKINTVFLSFSTNAIATIIYPLYAESSSKDDYDRLNRIFNLTLSIYFFFLLPLSCGLFIFKRELITLAFARGAFDSSAVEITQSLFGFYIIAIMFMAMRETITKVFNSMEDTKTPARNATIGIGLNIIFSITLPLIMGVQGLALGTSITAVFISTRLLYQLYKKNKSFEFSKFKDSAKRSMLASIVMTAVVVFLKYFMSQYESLIILITCLIIGLSIYVVVQFLLKQEIIFKLLKSLHGKKINS